MLSVGDFLKRHPFFSFDIRECIRSYQYKDFLAGRLRSFDALLRGDVQEVTPAAFEAEVRNHLCRHIPAYSSYEEFASFDRYPTITKDRLRANPQLFRNISGSPDLWVKRSTGTTGRPFDTFLSAEFHLEELFLSLRKIALSKHVEIGRHEVFCVTLFQSDIKPAIVHQDPLESIGLMARLSIDERRPDSIKHAIEFMLQNKPELVVSKPTFFEAILRSAAGTQLLRKIGAKLVVSSGCALHEGLRDEIGRVFGCPVTDAYVLSEFGMVAAECPAESGLHVDTTGTFAETHDSGGNIINDGARGEIVLSSLRNSGMLLIRYRTGDTGVLDPSKCWCGNPSPRLVRIAGKDIPCFWASDGTGFDPSRLNHIVFRETFTAEYQALQTAPNIINVVLYPADSAKGRIPQRLKAMIRAAIPNIFDVQICASDSPPNHPAAHRFVRVLEG
ncbi:MAG TPA: hypothetical protein VEY09_18850 [Pyrinomonadaceae bacterium]|nr:hypothetical protein [Pyrinomonadaceae bacterium]